MTDWTEGELYTQSNEGCRLTAYQDTGGIWTNGYGCTGPDILQGTQWTQRQADYEFTVRYAAARFAARAVLGSSIYDALIPWRQYALNDIAYECGRMGLSRFVKMIGAIRDSNWQVAHDECIASELPPGRARRNAMALLIGEKPNVDS